MSLVAPATPTTIAATDTIPSLAPRTPARSQFRRCTRSLLWGSLACCPSGGNAICPLNPWLQQTTLRQQAASGMSAGRHRGSASRCGGSCRCCRRRSGAVTAQPVPEAPAGARCPAQCRVRGRDRTPSAWSAGQPRPGGDSPPPGLTLTQCHKVAVDRERSCFKAGQSRSRLLQERGAQGVARFAGGNWQRSERGCRPRPGQRGFRAWPAGRRAWSAAAPSSASAPPGSRTPSQLLSGPPGSGRQPAWHCRPGPLFGWAGHRCLIGRRPVPRRCCPTRVARGRHGRGRVALRCRRRQAQAPASRQPEPAPSPEAAERFLPRPAGGPSRRRPSRHGRDVRCRSWTARPPAPAAWPCPTVLRR